jgi:hypothetical protein
VAPEVRKSALEYRLSRLEVVTLVLLAFALLEAHALVGFPGAASVVRWSKPNLALIAAKARRIRRRSLLGFHWLLDWKSSGSFFWPWHSWWRMQWGMAPWWKPKLALITAKARRIRRRSLLGFHWLLDWKSSDSFFWPSHCWWRMQWGTWPDRGNQDWL